MTATSHTTTRHTTTRPTRRPVVLIVLDGWGLSDQREGNAVALADTPCFDELQAHAPKATLITHGERVGLPEGQMGNSEVGHMNLGAGRVVWMDLPRIDKSMREGEFARMPALTDFIARLRASGGTAHLMGLMSPGGVHSHQRHIAMAARVLAAAGVPVALHLFLDGRDTPPKSAMDYLADFRGECSAPIATIAGRFYAMDRDKRWERVQQAWAAIVRAEGQHAHSAEAAIAHAYARDESDEFVLPTVVGDYAGMTAQDGVLMMNFRADRAREILSALGDPAFDGFDRGNAPLPAVLCGVVEYSTRHNQFMSTIFPQVELKNTLGAWVAQHGLRQFRVAETEKYPHVTFFFNGGVEEPNPGEERFMAPSPKVRTYDLQPEMSAAAVTSALVAAIRSGQYDLIICNFANPDMVGHTGDLAAAIAACAAVDQGLAQAVAAVRAVDGAMIICADHGNCEQMIDPETGGPHTAHTLNPVPIMLVGGGNKGLRAGGALCDVAPTLLALLGLPQPAEMSGQSLLVG